MKVFLKKIKIILPISSNVKWNISYPEFTWTNLQQHVKGMKEKPVFVSATDGNHGYGLAYAAKLLKCDCIIYMPVVISKGLKSTFDSFFLN